MIKREKKHFNKSDTLSGLLFCSLWLIGFLALTLYPLIESLIYSFSTVSVEANGDIIVTANGWRNYAYALIQDSEFTAALQGYATEIILYVPVITVISLILAMLLNSKLKGTSFFRTLFFLPVIITSGPVIELFISQGVASFPGIADLINFTELSQSVPQFLVDALKFLTDEFIMILWFCGVQILVFMTGLQKIDKSVYEAAKIDGASSWECFWKITLPAINPTLVINVVFTVIMQSIFSLNPIITKITNDMNGTGEGSGYGYASAMAWIYFVVLIVLLVGFVLLFKSKRKGSVK